MNWLLSFIGSLAWWNKSGVRIKPDQDHRRKIAQWIVDQEARRDKDGNIKLYTLPKADGGGKYEYAGINSRYHPAALNKILPMINAGRHEQAEAFAVSYIQDYVSGVEAYSPVAAIDAFLCDSAFNRGPGGATKVLQIALGVLADGGYGPVTAAALRKAERHPEQLINKLRDAREVYERKIAPPVGERAKFWNGLVNRWNNAEAYALSWL